MLLAPFLDRGRISFNASARDDGDACGSRVVDERGRKLESKFQ